MLPQGYAAPAERHNCTVSNVDLSSLSSCEFQGWMCSVGLMSKLSCEFAQAHVCAHTCTHTHTHHSTWQFERFDSAKRRKKNSLTGNYPEIQPWLGVFFFSSPWTLCLLLDSSPTPSVTHTQLTIGQKLSHASASMTFLSSSGKWSGNLSVCQTCRVWTLLILKMKLIS